MMNILNSEVSIRGKHAQIMRDLASTMNAKSETGLNLFNSNVQLFTVAAAVGISGNYQEDVDKSPGETKIFAEQIQKYHGTIEYLYIIAMLNYKKGELSAKDRINRAFRIVNSEPYTEEEVKLRNECLDIFMSYVRGGLSYLDEYFSDIPKDGTANEVEVDRYALNLIVEQINPSEEVLDSISEYIQ